LVLLHLMLTLTMQPRLLVTIHLMAWQN
jgi:hypothetical protein